MGRNAADAEESIFALANDDATEARAWLSDAFAQQRARGDAHALTAQQQEMIGEVLGLDWWQSVAASGTEASHEGHLDRISELLSAAVNAANTIPLASVVLSMYLRNLINEAWELNWDHRLIRGAIAAASGAAGSGDAAHELSWRLLGFMNQEFDVEAALLTGSLDAVILVSSRAVTASAPLKHAARALPDHPARSRLVAETRSEHTYYRVINEIARAAADLLTRRVHDAQPAITRIARLISSGEFRSVDASELRSHLASLESIGAAIERPWLHVDEGRVRIIYGFGVTARGSQDHAPEIDAVCALIDAGQTGEMLGPLRVAHVLPRLALSDVWQGTDSLGRRYRGSTIRLEDLVLREPNAPDSAMTIRAEVQLSELGNHTVLFDIDLHDAPAHDVARIVNLATPVYGDLTEIPHALLLHPSSGPSVRLSRLADIVSGILTSLRTVFRMVRGEASGDPVAARAGSFGVLVTVARGSRDAAGQHTALTSAREIRELWGAQPVLHPLPAGASGVADWTMYDVDDVSSHQLLHLNDELLAANANITLLASFRSPAYAVGEIEGFITFAHSMHGMYESWQHKVRDHAERIAELLTDVEQLLDEADAAGVEADQSRQSALIGELNARVGRIERAELELQSFVQSKHAIMLFVESPAIVSSPALRTDLDTVLRSNGYDMLRDGFERAVRDVLGSRLQPLLEVCQRRIERALEAQQAARDRRNEKLEQILGVVLAVIGVSGLVSVVQEGFGIKGATTWWFIVAILAIAIGIGIVMIVLSRRPRRPRSRTSERVNDRL